MKNIIDVLKYDGGDIKTGLLYINGSDPIILEGKVDFKAFGTVRMNGVKITDTEFHCRLSKPTEFKVEKDSAILFNSVPIVSKQIDGFIPVPDVPDMMDAQIAQMHMLFTQWAKAQGLQVKDEGDSPSTNLDDDENMLDDEDLYDFDIPLDSNIADIEEYLENEKKRNGDREDQESDQARDVLNGEEEDQNRGEEQVDKGQIPDEKTA